MKRTINRKRLALVLKMAFTIGCGATLAGCGSAKNPNNQANQAALVASLQQKLAGYQGKVNPVTGQVATVGSGSPINAQVWVSDCLANGTLGADGSGGTVAAYQEAYMFEGTAWFAEYAFWDQGDCSGPSVQPTSFPNAFGAGYVTNMPANIAVGQSFTLNMIAWDSTTSIGYSSTNNWGSALGLSVNMPMILKTLPTQVASSPIAFVNGSYGDLTIGDVVISPNPTAATLDLVIWNAGS